MNATHNTGLAGDKQRETRSLGFNIGIARSWEIHFSLDSLIQSRKTNIGSWLLLCGCQSYRNLSSGSRGT